MPTYYLYANVKGYKVKDRERKIKILCETVNRGIKLDFPS